jgi:hypothetical protein
MSNTINRNEYLNQLIALKDKELIKVITGVRRCGKSTLMEIFQKYLISTGVSEDRIISINFEDYEYYDMREPATLNKSVKSGQ